MAGVTKGLELKGTDILLSIWTKFQKHPALNSDMAIYNARLDTNLI